MLLCVVQIILYRCASPHRRPYPIPTSIPSLCFPVPQLPHLETSKSKEAWPVSTEGQTLQGELLPKGDPGPQDRVSSSAA